MFIKKKYYQVTRAFLQLQKCDSNGKNPKGFTPLILSRADLTKAEANEFDALVGRIIDRMNTAAKPATATDAAASVETKSA